MTTINELIEFVEMGGGLEMPMGLARRLVAAGYRVPGKPSADDSLAAMNAALVELVLGFEGDEIDAACAGLLAGMGVSR